MYIGAYFLYQLSKEGDKDMETELTGYTKCYTCDNPIEVKIKTKLSPSKKKLQFPATELTCGWCG